jgi:hypothetical protein
MVNLVALSVASLSVFVNASWKRCGRSERLHRTAAAAAAAAEGGGEIYRRHTSERCNRWSFLTADEMEEWRRKIMIQGIWMERCGGSFRSIFMTSFWPGFRCQAFSVCDVCARSGTT